MVIGDTQVKPGVPTAHLGWIGRYIVDHLSGTGQDTTTVHVGDHWDFPSLSSYDRGKRAMEGRRYVDDLDAGNEAFELLDKPLRKFRGRLRKVFLKGNHENRRTLAMEDNPQLFGALADINTLNWEVHDFLEPVDIHGVICSHYFYNPNTSKPYTGEVTGRLKTLGHSFIQGHQQGMQYGQRPVGRSRHQGLVLGTTYLHDEVYRGPQATEYWRGIVVCHQVENGTYDPMFVSLDYLCRRYEKKTLEQFMKTHRMAA